MNIDYRIKKERERKIKMNEKGSTSLQYISKASNEYSIRKERKQKEIIDEINRLNLTNDYGV